MRAVLGFLATVAFVSATNASCINDSFEELVSKTSCGCSKKLSRCLSAVNLTRSNQIEQCFIASGCEEADALNGATWFAHECQAEKTLEAQGELKRRADDDETTSATKKGGKTTAEDTASDQETSTDNEKTTAKSTEAKTTKAAASTTAPSTADATTTSAAATTAAATSSSDSSTASSTTSASKASVTAASETTGSTTSSLVCSVTNMVTTSVCSVSKGKTITCTPTITPTATCAPGVICQTDDAGNDVCLRRDNHLTTSGVVVTIAFAVSIIGAAISILVAQYRTRSGIRRREVERMALLGGGAYARNGKGRAAPDVEATQTYGPRNPSEAHVPLMSPGGARSEQHGYPQQHNAPDYFNAPGGSSSVSPNGAGQAAPKLHPGLGALGQNYS